MLVVGFSDWNTEPGVPEPMKRCNVREAARAAAVILALAWPGAVFSARAEVASVPASRDATVIESADGTLGNGAGTSLFVGRTAQATFSIRRAVLFFDVAAAIQPGSTIEGAALTLSLAQANSGAVPAGLHRLESDWGEGPSIASGGTGAPAEPGDVTWTRAFFPDTLWSSPGGDFDPQARAVTEIDQPGLYSWGPTASMTADVQSWIEDPDSNHGWILLGDEQITQSAKRFDSREAGDPLRRPVLVVEFTPPCLETPRPLGAGHWHRQCLGLPATGRSVAGPGSGGGRTPPGGGAGPRRPTLVGFEQDVLPCVETLLAGLGLTGTTPCTAVDERSAQEPCGRALRLATTLAFNLCSGRVQASCELASPPGCEARTASERLAELAAAIRGGDCGSVAPCPPGGD